MGFSDLLRRRNQMQGNSFVEGESVGIPNELWQQINPIMGRMLSRNSRPVSSPKQPPVPLMPRRPGIVVNPPVQNPGAEAAPVSEDVPYESGYSRERIIPNRPTLNNEDTIRPRTVGYTPTEWKIKNREAYMTDPSLKNAVENKPSLMKRAGIGAQVGINEALNSVQQSRAQGFEPSGLEAGGKLLAGTLGAIFNPKKAADIQNAAELEQLYGQQQREQGLEDNKLRSRKALMDLERGQADIQQTQAQTEDIRSRPQREIQERDWKSQESAYDRALQEYGVDINAIGRGVSEKNRMTIAQMNDKTRQLIADKNNKVRIAIADKNNQVRQEIEAAKRSQSEEQFRAKYPRAGQSFKLSEIQAQAKKADIPVTDLIETYQSRGAIIDLDN